MGFAFNFFGIFEIFIIKCWEKMGYQKVMCISVVCL